MAKERTLRNLKVRVNKDGTLSKKSLEEIRRVTQPSVLNKLVPQIGVRDITHVAGFVGLTVAIKMGIVDPLSFFLGTDWFPGKNIGNAVESAEQTIREAFDNQWTKREKLLLRNILLLNKQLRSQELTEGQRGQLVTIRDAMEAEIVGMPAEGSDERDTEFQKWFAENRDAVEWLTAMGITELAFKLAESHTVNDIVELAPGQ